MVEWGKFDALGRIITYPLRYMRKAGDHGIQLQAVSKHRAGHRRHFTKR